MLKKKKMNFVVGQLWHGGKVSLCWKEDETMRNRLGALYFLSCLFIYNMFKLLFCNPLCIPANFEYLDSRCLPFVPRLLHSSTTLTELLVGLIQRKRDLTFSSGVRSPLLGVQTGGKWEPCFIGVPFLTVRLTSVLSRLLPLHRFQIFGFLLSSPLRLISCGSHSFLFPSVTYSTVTTLRVVDSLSVPKMAMTLEPCATIPVSFPASQAMLRRASTDLLAGAGIGMTPR